MIFRTFQIEFFEQNSFRRSDKPVMFVTLLYPGQVRGLSAKNTSADLKWKGIYVHFKLAALNGRAPTSVSPWQMCPIPYIVFATQSLISVGVTATLTATPGQFQDVVTTINYTLASLFSQLYG